MQSLKDDYRSNILTVITTPLGFFVLSLLIVESFLGAILIGGNLDKSDTFVGMLIGVGMFIIVIISVFVLAWFKPQSLTFDKDAHLTNRSTFRESNEESNILKNFWQPKGSIDIANEERLKIWMHSNGLDTESITMFIYSETFQDSRRQAVSDLGLRKQ